MPATWPSGSRRGSSLFARGRELRGESCPLHSRWAAGGCPLVRREADGTWQCRARPCEADARTARNRPGRPRRRASSVNSSACSAAPQPRCRRRQSHQRAAVGGVRIDAASKRLPGAFEPIQRSARRDADVEAVAIDDVLPVAPQALDATRLSARQSAIDVSSVHSPGARRNGPPPIMSSIGGGLEENSLVVPSASPVASPSRQPRTREAISGTGAYFLGR